MISTTGRWREKPRQAKEAEKNMQEFRLLDIIMQKNLGTFKKIDIIAFSRVKKRNTFPFEQTYLDFL